jgi:predicted phosphodiesterase
VRLAIISDIHEDIRALETVLRQIRKKGYDLLACLGDISGAGSSMYPDTTLRDARACLELIREACDIVLPGNHDMHASERFPQYPIGFTFPPDWYRLDNPEQKEVSDGKLWPHEDDLDPGYDGNSIEYLRSLPEYKILDAVPFRILLSHYFYPDLTGFRSHFRTESEELEDHFGFMENLDCDVAFTGHFHPEGFTVSRHGRFSLNGYRSMQISDLPVIFGVPPVTSFRQRTGYCIFDTGTKEAHFCKIAV